MKHFWGFVETTIDIAVPFVAMWLVYAVFVSPEHPDQGFVTACSLFLAFHFMVPNHHQAIGGAGPKSEQKPH